MIDGVKGAGVLKKENTGVFLVTFCSDELLVEGRQCSFSGAMLSISRLLALFM